MYVLSPAVYKSVDCMCSACLLFCVSGGIQVVYARSVIPYCRFKHNIFKGMSVGL